MLARLATGFVAARAGFGIPPAGLASVAARTRVGSYVGHDPCSTTSPPHRLPTHERLRGNGPGQPDVVHVALQLVPQQLGVEFACCCAEHVQRVFQREFPLDDRANHVIATIRGWLRGEARKKDVRRVWATLAELTSQDARLPLEREDQWDQEQVEAEYLATCAGPGRLACCCSRVSSSEIGEVDSACMLVNYRSSISGECDIGHQPLSDAGVVPRRLQVSPEDEPEAERNWHAGNLLGCFGTAQRRNLTAAKVNAVPSAASDRTRMFVFREP